MKSLTKKGDLEFNFNTDYTSLYNKLTRYDDVELTITTTISGVFETYNVKCEDLPIITFNEFEKHQAEIVRTYLENNHHTDMITRKILQFWYKHDCKNELRDYLISCLNETKIFLNFNKLYADDRKILSIQIHYTSEIYMEDIMRYLGLFPNEFYFFKENNRLVCQILIDEMNHNDKMMNRCKYE